MILRTGVIRDRWLVASQCLSGKAWSAVAASVFGSPLRIRCCLRRSRRNRATTLLVQILDIDMFLLQPSTEIGDYDDLLSDRVWPVALLGHTGRIGVEVFTQRTLAQPFNRA